MLICFRFFFCFCFKSCILYLQKLLLPMSFKHLLILSFALFILLTEFLIPCFLNSFFLFYYYSFYLSYQILRIHIVFYNRYVFSVMHFYHFFFIPLFFSPNCVNIRQCLLSFIFIKKKKLIFS